MSILVPPSYQMEAIYATPCYALELQESGMTYAQIAHELNISTSQVKRWLKKAREEKSKKRKQ